MPSISAPRRFPSIPALDSDLILEIFTHKSIRYHGMCTHPLYGGGDRLALLGDRAVHLILTDIFFNLKSRFATSADIEVSSSCGVCFSV